MARNPLLDSLMGVDNADAALFGQAAGLPIEPTSLPLQPGLTNDELEQEQTALGQQTPIQPQTAVQAVKAPGPAPVAPQDEQSVPGQLLDKINSGEIGLAQGEASRGPAVDAPISELSRLEQLQKQLESLRSQEAQQIDDANREQRNKSIIAGATEGLGKYLVGGLQKNVKAPNINYSGPSAKEIMAIIGDTKRPNTAQQREELLKEYALLKKGEKDNAITPYQREYLDLTKEGQKIKREQIAAQARNTQNKLDAMGDKPTEGQKTTDREFAKDYNKLTSKGFNNAETAISRIEKIASELEKEGDKSISGGGRTSVLPDFLRTQDSIRWRDSAENEANSTLKELFPGSLSDDERRAAAREFYNDKLPNSENAKILRAKAAQLRRSMEDQRSKAEYFSKNKGTLSGMNQDNTTQSTGPLGETTERNGKRYRWNPAVGKYQLDQ